MTLARRILLLLITLGVLAAVPVGAPSGDVSSRAMDRMAMDPMDCCGTGLEDAAPCKAVCPSGSTVTIGSGLTLVVLEHASTLIPWSVRAPSSLARAPDTTPPKRSVV